MKKIIIPVSIVVFLIISSISSIGTDLDNQLGNEFDCQNSIEEDINYTDDNSNEYQTGLVEPDNWWIDAPFDPCDAKDRLPEKFDWRKEVSGGLPPVKDQKNCGSCWAFSTVGALECAVKIKYGLTVDLSEQWLVSCNTDNMGCNGGWFAHGYHLRQGNKDRETDKCGNSGAVLENDFIYKAWEKPCGCPYNHKYFIEDWSYIGHSHGVPSVDAIKQAIYDYGPVSAAVYAGFNFQYMYFGGVYDIDEGGSGVNHGIVLVGWDDSQGEEGVWILRNSWGPRWGEDGYMRIAYGTSNVGYGACYINFKAPKLKCEIDYPWGVLNFGDVHVGDSKTLEFDVKNTGEYGSYLHWKIYTDNIPKVGDWLIDPSEEFTLEKGEVTTVKLTFEPNPDYRGRFSGEIKVKNEDFTSNYVDIPIKIKVPRYRTVNNFFFNFLDQFPFLKLLF